MSLLADERYEKGLNFPNHKTKKVGGQTLHVHTTQQRRLGSKTEDDTDTSSCDSRTTRDDSDDNFDMEEDSESDEIWSFKNLKWPTLQSTNFSTSSLCHTNNVLLCSEISESSLQMSLINIENLRRRLASCERFLWKNNIHPRFFCKYEYLNKVNKRLNSGSKMNVFDYSKRVSSRNSKYTEVQSAYTKNTNGISKNIPSSENGKSKNVTRKFSNSETCVACILENGGINRKSPNRNLHIKEQSRNDKMKGRILLH